MKRSAILQFPKDGIMTPADAYNLTAALVSATPKEMDELNERLNSQSPERQEAFWLEYLSSPETVGQTLQAIIRLRKLTSYRLSKLSGVHSTAIQRFLRGERGLGLESIQKLLKALGLGLKVARLEDPAEKPAAPKKKPAAPKKKK
jgi:DNA-binding phage protein